MEEKIKYVISKLKRSYIERDVRNADELMSALFGDAKNALLIGTSNGEWYFTYDTIKNLFTSDWEYWGDVLIDDKKYNVENFGRYQWISLNASIEYIFTDTDERYERYYSTVADTANSDEPEYKKACQIEWLLSHLLHSRDSSTRKYLWDLQIQMIFENLEHDEFANSKPMCKIMQFSLPMSINYTDVRIDYESYNKQNYEAECSEIAKYNKIHQEDNADIKNSLIRKIQLYVSEKYENIIDTLMFQENIAVDCSGKRFCFCGSGVLKRELNKEQQLSEIMKKIINRDYSGNLKDSLFKIRRDISYTLKESAINSIAENPFRVIGIATVNNSETSIEKIDISFPFSMILEQKNDFAHQSYL